MRGTLDFSGSPEKEHLKLLTVTLVVVSPLAGTSGLGLARLVWSRSLRLRSVTACPGPATGCSLRFLALTGTSSCLSQRCLSQTTGFVVGCQKSSVYPPAGRGAGCGRAVGLSDSTDHLTTACRWKLPVATAHSERNASAAGGRLRLTVTAVAEA